jgi:uncharacterized membrane protein
MNRMLIVVFDTEADANVGVSALKQAHKVGELTLYELGLIAKDQSGKVSVKIPAGHLSVGTGLGIAVGGLIGLLGGPAGVAVGAAAGAMVGAVRDYLVTGVSLDFIESAEMFLRPGKAAIIADIEEDSVYVVDTSMKDAGGTVFRSGRFDVADAQLDHDIAGMRASLLTLAGEYKKAAGEAKAELQETIRTASAALVSAQSRAKQRSHEVEQEAELKMKSLKDQLSSAQGELRSRLEVRLADLRSTYGVRKGKLLQAWDITKDALTV